MQNNIFKLIKKQHVSEKALRIAEEFKQIVFHVDISATKTKIKAAVEKIFNVKVDSVTTAVIKGKTKRTKDKVGTRKKVKKAHVKLKEGYDINFVDAE